MAPLPGITSLDDHLLFDNFGMPLINFYSNPKSFLPYDKNAGGFTPKSGISPSVIFQDHDYVVKRKEENVVFAENRTDDSERHLGFDDQVDFTCVDFEDLMCTETDDAIACDNKEDATATACGPSPAMPVVVASSPRLNISDVGFPDRADDKEMLTDDLRSFLQGIDDLDLDFGCLDPSADVAMEDTFENFMDETLNNPLSQLAEEDDVSTRIDDSNNNDDEEEDAHKKEFFLKLLGLQAVSSTASRWYAPPPSSPNSDSLPLNGDSPSSPSLLNAPSSSRPEPISFPSLLNAASSAPVHDGDSQCCSQNEDDNQNSWQTAPISTNVQSSNFQGSCCVTSVPAKTCSCPVVDWKRSLVYSTAPVRCGSGVQTSLTTAISKHSTDHVIHNNNSSNSHIPYSGATHVDRDDFNPFSPVSAQLSSDAIISDLGVCQLRPDKDAEEFLRWLDLDEEDQAATPKGHNDNTTSPLTPSTDHSSADLDSFIDLEDFAAGSCVSSPMFSPEKGNNFHNHNSNNTNDHERVSSPRFESADDEKKNGGSIVDSDKYRTQYSELRFRLSLLDEGFMNDLGLEKRDAAAQPSGLRHHDAFGEFPFESVLSPLSPCSPSSVQSQSALSSRKPDENLHLLGLFSEENSSMLMERTDMAVSSMALL